MSNTRSNALGWLLDEQLGSVEGVRYAVLMSGDGLLKARTETISQDDGEKLAALTASLRASGRAWDDFIGGQGVRQRLIESVTNIGLTTAARQNTMLSVVTTGTPRRRRPDQPPHGAARGAPWQAARHREPQARPTAGRRHRGMTGPRHDPDMIRPYVRTGGQIRPGRAVRLESVVIAATGPTTDLGPDTRRVMSLFSPGRGGLAVADIAAALQLPPSTVRILVSSLMDSGHLASPAAADSDQPETDLLQKVLDGLRELV
nr:DUF742 domain-containing protein [Streptomyces triticisoli]